MGGKCYGVIPPRPLSSGHIIGPCYLTLQFLSSSSQTRSLAHCRGLSVDLGHEHHLDILHHLYVLLFLQEDPHHCNTSLGLSRAKKKQTTTPLHLKMSSSITFQRQHRLTTDLVIELHLYPQLLVGLCHATSDLMIRLNPMTTTNDS